MKTHHQPTLCCNYSTPLNRPYPVMWNEYNKVVQCHNCGEVWEPRTTRVILKYKHESTDGSDY